MLLLGFMLCERRQGPLGAAIHFIDKDTMPRTSLVAQWLKICLPMQGTRVRALVWEDPTCCNWAREPRLLSLHI